MLKRDRQIRMQIQQLADASLFAVCLLIAYALRCQPANHRVAETGAAQSV